jgi:uncharacterized hydrophobic protein (TIGR00271 family)
MEQRRIASLSDFQDRLAALLGCNPDQRPAVIANMLRQSPSEATGYWLQLFVAAGIATLGLVLGSTAVVIGAMLIAPLMGPIVSFGMGLAVGSPFLVVRSGVRILLSVVVAISSSSLITLALPFHELNTEIAARTTPTVLDLLTAGFCALAGVYASMRPGSEVASTAAGTSIGISLVPPLCASGYGVGVANWSVAGGAALLFLTNLIAIILVGTLAFAAAGFHQVGIARLETDELQKSSNGRVSRSRLDRRLQTLFASRSGPALRLLMPFLLLAAVYVPLRQGLDEVAWQIRARQQVDAALGRLSSRVVQSRIRVERQQVELTLVVVGRTSDAEAAKSQLDAELSKATGVTPRLDVFAVADAHALAGLEAALRAPALPPVLPRPRPSVQLDDARRLVRAAVERRWPARAVGQPLEISVTARQELVTLTVVHLGASLDASAVEALERALSEDLEHAIRVIDAPVPSEELDATSLDLALVGRLVPWLEAAKRTDTISVCVSEPPAPPPAPDGDDAAQPTPRSSIRDLLANYPRVSIQTGGSSRVRFVLGPCPIIQPAPQASENPNLDRGEGSSTAVPGPSPLPAPQAPVAPP